MPAFETKDLNQWAILWRVSSSDRYGTKTFHSPEEIRVRWVGKRKQIISPTGQLIGADATVITREYVPNGSLLREGRLEDWVGTGSNDDDEGILEVIGSDYTPDIKGRNYRYELMLVRYKDEVPPR
jgi:hypothetical protein